MSPIQIVGIVIMVVVVGSLVFTEVKRRTTYRTFERDFLSGKFDECLELLDRPLTRRLYQPFNLRFMRLNTLQAMGDNEAACKEADEMLELRVSKEQRAVLLSKAFNLYVEQGNRERSAELLEQVRKGDDKDATAECEMMFDIFFDKGSSHIDEMVAQLDKAGAAERVRLCYLIAIQYESRGDKKSADRYLALGREAFEEGTAPGAPTGGSAGEGPSGGEAPAPAGDDEAADK